MSKAELDQRIREAERLFDQRRLPEAGGIAEGVLAIKPTHAPALVLMGRIAFALRQYDQAAPYLEKAIAADRRQPFYHGFHGQIALAQGRLPTALASFERAVRLKPDYSDAIAGKAEALDRSGKRKRAIEFLAPAVKSGQATPRMAVAYVRAARAQGLHEEVMRTVEQQLALPDVPDTFRRSLLLVLGRSLDQLGEYDRAFEAFRAGNETGTPPFDIEEERRSFQALRSAFSRSATASLPRSERTDDLAVMVVGMPRSGSTLIEQIIHAHPQGAGAGEPRHLSQIQMRLGRNLQSPLPYPACVAAFTPPTIKGVGDEYLRRLRLTDRRADRIVDKNLENYRHLGLIDLLLPKTAVIHARRDPMDVCLSCYMQDLLQPWSFDLRRIGQYYREYTALMEFWAQEIDLPVLDLDYEALVADQEGESRRLIEFIGLPWDDRCLRYFEAKRSVITISYDQVNQPIYKGAAGRHVHYEKHLGPLREALGLA